MKGKKKCVKIDFIFMDIDTERKRIERWGKMTQSINCPLCKYKDPSVGSQHPHKVMWYSFVARDRGVESGGSLEVTGQRA